MAPGLEKGYGHFCFIFLNEGPFLDIISGDSEVHQQPNEVFVFLLNFLAV